MDAVSKRIVFSWIATDIVWCALLVYSLKKTEKRLRAARPPAGRWTMSRPHAPRGQRA